MEVDPAGPKTGLLLVCGVVAGPLFVMTFIAAGADACRLLSAAAFDQLAGPWPVRVGPDRQLSGCWRAVAGVCRGPSRELERYAASPLGAHTRGVVGCGLLGAGAFVTDSGYPPGSPVSVEEPTLHGILHNLSAGVGFPALIAACLVFARRFARQGKTGLSLYSAASALAVLAFVVLAGYGFGRTGGLSEVAGPFQRISVGAGWTWLTVLALVSLRDERAPPP
jgi:hypothetical protein